MALSIFEKKTKMPGDEDLSRVLGDLLLIWKDIKEFVLQNSADVYEEWNYSGKSFGWSFRLRNPKKVIIYMTPCENMFKVSFVFGPAATEEAIRSNISDEIKYLIESAKVYTEGRGIRIDVTDRSKLEDIHRLILIKLGIKNSDKRPS